MSGGSESARGRIVLARRKALGAGCGPRRAMSVYGLYKLTASRWARLAFDTDEAKYNTRLVGKLSGITDSRRTKMAKLSKLKGGQGALSATCLAMLFTFGPVAWPQSPPIKIILTGQSMIRADIRLYTPSIVSTMGPLLKGDVVFTNFEATVAEKGQPNETVPREGNSLAPPEAMDALKDLGFNMLE